MSWKSKTVHQFRIVVRQRSHHTNYAIHIGNLSKRHYSTTLLNYDDEELNEDNLGQVRDISELISSTKSPLKPTSKDYYSEYGESFFNVSYQNMLTKVENADEFNPQISLSKKYEDASLINIESGVIKTPSNILKIQLKVTEQHLRDKKRTRLDDYLFRRLIFAVFHYTNQNKTKDTLMDPIQLRFRLFDSKARKKARQTLRKFRAEKQEQEMVEKESIFSPLTLTQLRLSRAMINRFITENGAIVNDLVHIFRPSYKLKQHDQIICYIPYSFLLEQYHKRIAQLFIHTLQQKQGNNDSENEHKNVEGDTGLKVYDIEREVSRIDAELIRDAINDSDIDGDEHEHEIENEDENESEQVDEHHNTLQKMMGLTTRTVTNQHVYEWLQLIGQQIAPSPNLITKNKIYTKDDIVLYEDDDIMVVNKPPNIAVHPTFSTGCDFSNSLLNFLLFHCPKLRDIQFNAINSFKDATFDDLLFQSTNIEDEHDINLFYSHIQNKNLDLDVQLFRDEDSDFDHEEERQIFINSPLEDIIKPGIVHRIDRHTSGLLVVGKNIASCRFLQQQFGEHSIGREYLAVTHNKLAKELWSEENYIERHPVHRTKFHVMEQPQRSPFSLLTNDDIKEENIVRHKLGRMSYEEEEQMKKDKTPLNVPKNAAKDKELMKKLKLLNENDVNTEMLQQYQCEMTQKQRRGKNEFENRQKRVGRAKLAVTHFRELETFEYVPKKQKKTHRFSLLNCKLTTGRTHQVRVHCHNMKIPVVGDNVYYVKEYKKYENELFDEITNFHEMHYLHAYLLKFKHINGRTGQFTANPPEMFTKVLGRLRTLSIMAE